MDISGISSSVTTPSTQKVTNVTNSVEGGNSNPPTVKAPEVAKQPESMDAILKQLDVLNKLIEKSGQSLNFGVDESTESTVIKVVDKSTEELIRQIPTEDSLKLLKNIQEYLERSQQNGSAGNSGFTGSLLNEMI